TSETCESLHSREGFMATRLRSALPPPRRFAKWHRRSKCLGACAHSHERRWAQRMRMKRAHAAIFIASASLIGLPVHASHHGWAQASNVGRDMLAVAALGVPAV